MSVNSRERLADSMNPFESHGSGDSVVFGSATLFGAGGEGLSSLTGLDACVLLVGADALEEEQPMPMHQCLIASMQMQHVNKHRWFDLKKRFQLQHHAVAAQMKANSCS